MFGQFRFELAARCVAWPEHDEGFHNGAAFLVGLADDDYGEDSAQSIAR